MFKNISNKIAVQAISASLFVAGASQGMAMECWTLLPELKYGDHFSPLPVEILTIKKSLDQIMREKDDQTKDFNDNLAACINDNFLRSAEDLTIEIFINQIPGSIKIDRDGFKKIRSTIGFIGEARSVLAKSILAELIEQTIEKPMDERIQVIKDHMDQKA